VRCSVLIVSFNTCQLTLQAIGSVAASSDVETIVVDNASRDGSASAIAQQFPHVRLVRCGRNLGFAGGVNRAACEAAGEFLLVLNSDACLQPGALDLMLELMRAEARAALVAPALAYPDGRPQSAAFAFPGLLQIALDLHPVNRLMESRVNGRIRASQPRPIDHPLGACMLIRRAAWQQVGPLDEGYFMYLEEIDWCRRAQALGWQIWHLPQALAIHHGGASTRQQPEAMYAQLWRSRLRYYRRFDGPIYNRIVHVLIRLGLGRRGAAAERVRQLIT